MADHVNRLAVVLMLWLNGDVVVLCWWPTLSGRPCLSSMPFSWNDLPFWRKPTEPVVYHLA